MANINIGGRLHSTATGNVVAGANEILDDVKGKKQSVINQEVDVALAGKQEALIGAGTGQNIKTVGGNSILGTGDIPIQAGDTNAIKYVAQSLEDSQKAQARTNIGAQETLVGTGTGQNIKTINQTSLLGSGDITVEDGVGFDTIETPQTADGTTLITLTNGDTITLDLNHQHPQYPKYVYCATQADYDAITTKESDTVYLILETQ